MNTPTPTPRTDAATYSADCLGTTLVTNRDLARALETELVTLTGTYTCTHHNDAERTACPVCLVTALTAERDQLRGALALGQLNCDTAYDELRADCDELRGDVVRLATERDQLRTENTTLRAAQKACEACDEPTAFEVRQFRSEVERLRSDRDCEKRIRKDAEELREDAIARAEKAERAETVAIANWNGALERALKAEAERDHLHAQLRALTLICGTNDANKFETWVDRANARAERAEAELASERGRLDYLSTRGFEHRHHETGDHLGYEWTISSYSESEDVTLRDVIDAEMREDEK